jgi:hypothetical protein
VDEVVGDLDVSPRARQALGGGDVPDVEVQTCRLERLSL